MAIFDVPIIVEMHFIFITPIITPASGAISREATSSPCLIGRSHGAPRRWNKVRWDERSDTKAPLHTETGTDRQTDNPEDKRD